jgi:hypothetical protein
MVLGHDVNEIVTGSFKGRAFQKGHILRLAHFPQSHVHAGL